jgi:hypothetical protein
MGGLKKEGPFASSVIIEKRITAATIFQLLDHAQVNSLDFLVPKLI